MGDKMKKNLSVFGSKKIKLLLNKTICVALSFSLLLNLATPAFAGFKQQVVKDKQVLAELEDALQEEYTKKKPKTDPAEGALKDCLEKKNYGQCDNYISILSQAFVSTRNNIETGKEIKEETFTPISSKEYKKQLKENTEKEYSKNIELIEKQFNTENQILDFQYKNVIFNTPEYSDYLLAKSNLSNWKKENTNNLISWKEEVLNNTEKYYNLYLKEFDKSVTEYKKEREEALNKLLKELANNLMQVYDKTTVSSRLKAVDLFVMLLSMETKDVKFFTGEQRSKLFKILTNFVAPTGRKDQNPCRFHTRARYDSEMKDFNEYIERKSKAEEERRNTLSIRDQVAKQVRPYEEAIANDLRSPITEPVDEEACELAFSAINGLSFFKGWDMSSVATFMIQNTTEPIASQALLMGAKTLIDSNRVDYFYVLHLDLIRQEDKFADEEDLKLKERMFFDNRFYRGPYLYSRYTKEQGGGDAWQDIVQMLAREKTYLSTNVQQEIFDHSISFTVGTGKVRFNHNLPFVYGLILHNPKVIDSYIPSSAVAYSYGGYEYHGKQVNFQYSDESVDLYVRDNDKEPFYLSDRTLIRDLESNTEVSVGYVRKEALEKYKENKQKGINAYLSYFEKKNKKPSEVYAEAFYNADFVDLTAEEKLAMDKALEKKYPHLKKISKGHKQKLENNRRNLSLVTGAITVVDVALTFWCVADIYKIAKWSVKSFKALRTLITVSKTTAALSTARKITFFRSLVAENKEILNVHRRIKKIKSVGSRVANKFPAYSQGIPLIRISHDGTRVLNVTKLDGTPIRIGQNTKKGKAIESEFTKIMMGTRDFVGVPAGMQGQRLAVQHYNKFLASPREGNAWGKLIKVGSTAKIGGPIHIFEKDGVTPLSYKEIKFNKEGYLEVDGDLFKTFKATIDPKDISKYTKLLEGTIADLEKTLALNKEKMVYFAENIKTLSADELLAYEELNNKVKYLELLKQKRYITLRLKNQPFSIAEKWRLHKKGYEIVPLYDVNNKIIANVSLDMALKNSETISQTFKNGNKLLLKDGKITLGGEVLDVNIGAPKEVITLMANSGRELKDFSFLNLVKKPSKMWPLFFNNMLSLSAGSTSLNMSLNQAPFNNQSDPNYIPQPLIFGVSVGFPYVFSLLSPMAAPFVKRYGAANVQTVALIIGGSGMTYAALNKYNGFASKKRDANDKPIYDENGHTMTAEKAPSYRPLVVASLAAGISSSFTRASLNAAIHRYQTTKASMTISMLAKNVGSLSMVLLPWGAQAIYGKNNVDFSVSYPALAGLSVLGILTMKGFIPSSVAREFKYKIMPNKIRSTDKWYKFWKWKTPTLRDLGDASKEIFKPFTLFRASKIMPYYLSYLSFGATESYVLFKTYNSFSRDSVENYMTAHTNASKNFNKLLASTLVTIPSAAVRLWVKRKNTFSQGIFNSILLTSAGTLGLMLPGEDHSYRWNIGVGILSGILVGCGTANMYQYLQKTMIAGIEDIALEGVLPLARKFNGVTGLTTTAISFYSGAYIGSFIPYGYSLLSEKELKKGATDFEANQKVLPLALNVYALGTIPLLFTPMGKTFIGKVRPFTPLVSLPLGWRSVNKLYNQSHEQLSLQIPHTPKFTRDIPMFNLTPVKPVLQVMPYQDFKIKPFINTENQEEQTEQ